MSTHLNLALGMAARGLAALGLGLAAAPASASSQSAGALLALQFCESPVPPSQAFVINSNSVTNGGLCVTYGGSTSAALTLQACGQPLPPSQAWTFDSATGAFSGSPAGTPVWWNTQGGNGIEGPGSIVSVWPSSGSPGFNEVFQAGFPLAGQISETASAPGNSTFSNLCVNAAIPPTPITPPVPNATIDQVLWQGQGSLTAGDIAVFIHFNMATAAGTQGCGGCGGTAPPPISLWNPSALDTDAWIAAGVAMGATRFIYVAKHGCGFFAYNSSVPYPYSAAHSSAPNADVVSRFVASAKKAGVGFGFYYSVVSNQMCNVCNGVVQKPAGPGQLDLTQDQYNALALAQLTELWGNFGPLAEVWFDGGYSDTMKANLTALAAKLQPHVVAFGGQDIVASPARWVGTEAGYAPYPCWSTDNDPSGDGGGNPDGSQFIPAETDFTLQNGDQWFYNAGAGVHSPAQLRAMYETSVGHNSPVIIDFAPMPNGSIPAAQVAAAATLGTFVHGCYGAPLATTTGSGHGGDFLVTLPMPGGAPATIDRVLASEDYAATRQQRVRGFTLSAALANGTVVDVFGGSSLGAKFIAVLASPLAGVVSVTLNVTAATRGSPYIRALSAFSCDALAARLDAEWDAQGHAPPPPPSWQPEERYVRPWGRS